MRTTLDIADDVLHAAKELARRERTTAGKVLSELARRALCQQAGLSGTSTSGGEPRAFLGFHPFPRRGGVVTNEMVNRLREDDGE